MNLYIASPEISDKYAQLVYSQEIDDIDSYIFKGEKVNQWNPIPFKWFLDSNISKKDLIFNDIVFVHGAGINIAVNEKAKSAINDLEGNNIQFLPVSVLGEEDGWYLINILNVVENVVNTEMSKYSTRRNGEKGRITDPVFESNRIPKEAMFTACDFPRKLMVESDFLKDKLDDSSVVGLRFKLCQLDLHSDSVKAS